MKKYKSGIKESESGKISFQMIQTSKFSGGPELSVLKPKQRAWEKPGTTVQSCRDAPPGWAGSGPGFRG